MDKTFITTTTLKQYSNIEANVEATVLRPSMIQAQKIHLQNVLGTRLCDIYHDAIDEDGTLTGLTTLQTTFYNDYVVPMLCAYVEAEFLGSNAFRQSNVGVVRVMTDKTSPASLEDIKWLKGEAMNKGDFYAQRAKVFLCDTDNYTGLGEYYQASDQNLSPAKKPQGGGLYTPHR